ncbi:unnamed protein product [Closterium sp. NIES-54]
MHDATDTVDAANAADVAVPCPGLLPLLFSSSCIESIDANSAGTPARCAACVCMHSATVRLEHLSTRGTAAALNELMPLIPVEANEAEEEAKAGEALKAEGVEEREEEAGTMSGCAL